MYGTGKPFHGCANLFVFFPLIFYIVSTTFLLDVDGAYASPSQREIKEAQQIVGRFLRDDAGTKWLSGLAKTKTAPLTTEDLMNAILQATRPGGKVWRAASILSDAVKAQIIDGFRPDSFMGQSENWKDLIADIEKEDDIICLYRKNVEQTAKKAEDWQKFLKTVSPGYTVHLAIDTGLKYVICLKKIDAPEAMSTEFSIARGTLSTVASPLFLHEVTTPTPALYPITPGKIVPITSSIMKIYSNNAEPVSESEESDEPCDDEETEDDRSEDVGSEEDVSDGDVVDDKDEKGSDSSYVNEHSEENQKPLNSGTRWQRPISYPIAQNNYYLQNRGWPSYLPLSAHGRFIPQSFIRNEECNRPIFLVFPDRNVPLGYQPRPPPWFPVQRSFAPPQLSSTPRIPTFLPKTLGPPFNPFVSIGKPSVRPQWQHRSPTRNVYLPRSRFPDQSSLVRNNFQSRLEQEKRDMLRRLILNVLKRRLQSRLSSFKPISAPVVSKRMQQFIRQFPRPLMYSKFPVRDFSHVKCALPARIPLLRTQKLDCFSPQLVDHLRSFQRQLQMLQQMRLQRLQQRLFAPNHSIATIPRSQIVNLPCFNSASSPTENVLFGHRTVACPRPCDKPIELQIFIQGKVQEPLKVSVLTDPGQRVEIVGSRNSIMPYGSRADTSGSLVQAEPEESKEETEPVVAEVARRMEYRADETEEKEEETSTTECTSVQSEELTIENKSTSTSGTKATTSDEEEIEISNEQEIGERFFREKTTDSTSSVEANSTMSTIANSTFIA